MNRNNLCTGVPLLAVALAVPALAQPGPCDALGPAPLYACRHIQVTTNPTNALGSTVIVEQADTPNCTGSAQGCCQDNTVAWDVRITVNADHVQHPDFISVSLVIPHGTTSIRRLEIRGTMQNAPLRIHVQGTNGDTATPDYFNAELQEMIIDPGCSAQSRAAAKVHVQFSGILSDLGRIECGSITSLILLDNSSSGASPTCGTAGEHLIGGPGTLQPSQILVRNNPNMTTPSAWPKGIQNVTTRSLSNYCSVFRPKVFVENGVVSNWDFPSSWKLQSPEFRVTNSSNGNIQLLRAAQIGPTSSGARVQMQAKNIDTFTTSVGGIYADITAETIDSMGGDGILAQQGLSGSIVAQSIADGSRISFSNPSTLNGV